MSGIQLLMLLLWQALQIAILVTVTKCILRIVGKGKPFLAHALWAVVLVKCVTPPLWSSSVGIFSQIADRVEIEMLHPLVSNTQPTEGASRSGVDVAITKHEARSPQLAATMSLDPIATAAFPTAADGDARVTAQAPNVTPSCWLVLGLLGVWVVGVFCYGIRLIFRLGAFLHRLRTIPVKACPQVDRETRALARQLRLRRRVQIDVVDAEIGPAVLGWLRPRVLLPAMIVDRAEIQSLRPLIAHELVHLRRGDLWWAGLQELATCFWWFHPWVRHAASSLTIEAEKSCDQETIAALRCEPADYARSLLDVLECKQRLRSAPTFPGVRAIDITTERMERIMNTDVHQNRHPRVWVWPLMLLGCGIVLPGAGMLSAQNAEEVQMTESDHRGGATAKPRVLANPASAPSSPRQSGNSSVAEESWTVRVYQVDRLLQRLRRSGIDQASAEQRVLDMLPGSDSDPLRRTAEIHTEDGVFSFGGSQPDSILRDGKLILFGTPAIHQQVANLIQHGEQYGFAAVRIEASLILVPQERWSDLGIQWQSIGHERASRIDPSQQGSSDASELHDARVLPGIVNLPRFVRGRTSLPHAAQPAVSGQTTVQSAVRQVSAATIIEHPNVIDLAILDNNPTRQLVESVKGVRVISMPRVITINGRSATIEIGKTEQVLGSDKSDRDGDRLQPVREEISVGTKLMLLPVVVEDRYVELSLDLRLTRLLDCENDSSNSDSQPGSAVRALASSRIETMCHVPLDSTLAVGGLEVVEDGTPYRLLCLFRCDRVRDETEGPTRQAPSPLHAKQTTANEGLHTLSFTAGVRDLALGGALSSFDLLGKRRVKVRIQGNMRAQSSQDQTTLQIQPIQIEWVDGDRITARRAEIRIVEGTPTTAQLHGKVSLVLGDRKFQADQAKIRGEKLFLSGNVHVTAESMTMSTDELQMSVGDMGGGN